MNDLKFGGETRHRSFSMSNSGIPIHTDLYILSHALRSHILYDTPSHSLI